jgi:hypothetical protein
MMRHLVVPFAAASLMAVSSYSASSFAAQILKVKGHSALINLEGDPASSGDLFYATSGGKRKAIVRISKVKGDKAIGKILKGKAGSGMSLIPRSGAQTARARGRTGGGSSASINPTGRSYWGVLLGVSMDSMSVNVYDYYPPGESKGTVGLSGMGFSGKALFDYELLPQVWFRGTGGLEQFNVSGTALCGVANAEACDAKLIYLSLDFAGRYVFSYGKFRPWAGLGISLLFPATKNATALDAASIGTTNAVVPQAGLDWFLSSTMYIPISVEYAMLPKSDQVNAHWIAVRAGLAVPF